RVRAWCVVVARAQRLAAGAQGVENAVDVVDAAAPSTTARVLQRGPQAGVGRQPRMRGDGGMHLARGQQCRRNAGVERWLAAEADEVEAAFEAAAVDLDP